MAHQTLSEDDVTLFLSSIGSILPSRLVDQQKTVEPGRGTLPMKTIRSHPLPTNQKGLVFKHLLLGSCRLRSTSGEEHQAGHHFDLSPPPLIAGARPPTVAYKGNALAPEIAFTLDRGGHRGY